MPRQNTTNPMDREKTADRKRVEQAVATKVFLALGFLEGDAKQYAKEMPIFSSDLEEVSQAVTVLSTSLSKEGREFVDIISRLGIVTAQVDDFTGLDNVRSAQQVTQGEEWKPDRGVIKRLKTSKGKDAIGYMIEQLSIPTMERMIFEANRFMDHLQSLVGKMGPGKDLMKSYSGDKASQGGEINQAFGFGGPKVNLDSLVGRLQVIFNRIDIHKGDLEKLLQKRVYTAFTTSQGKLEKVFNELIEVWCFLKLYQSLYQSMSTGEQLRVDGGLFALEIGGSDNRPKYEQNMKEWLNDLGLLTGTFAVDMSLLEIMSECGKYNRFRDLLYALGLKPAHNNEVTVSVSELSTEETVSVPELSTEETAPGGLTDRLLPEEAETPHAEEAGTPQQETNFCSDILTFLPSLFAGCASALLIFALPLFHWFKELLSDNVAGGCTLGAGVAPSIILAGLYYNEQIKKIRLIPSMIALVFVAVVTCCFLFVLDVRPEDMGYCFEIYCWFGLMSRCTVPEPVQDCSTTIPQYFVEHGGQLKGIQSFDSQDGILAAGPANLVDLALSGIVPQPFLVNMLGAYVAIMFFQNKTYTVGSCPLSLGDLQHAMGNEVHELKTGGEGGTFKSGALKLVYPGNPMVCSNRVAGTLSLMPAWYALEDQDGEKCKNCQLEFIIKLMFSLVTGTSQDAPSWSNRSIVTAIFYIIEDFDNNKITYLEQLFRGAAKIENIPDCTSRTP